MNRQERRRAEATARKAVVRTEVAFHEAGHAVARLLTSEALGYSPAEAVHEIRLAPGGSGMSGDGRAMLVSQAVCTGPMVSKGLDLAVRQVIDVTAEISGDRLWQAFATAGTPEDREISMRSRMLVDVMGAAAETRHLGRSHPLALFLTYACEDDRQDFKRNCKVLGFAQEEVASIRDEYIERARTLVDRPSVWAAITALAGRLRGSMPGSRVAELAWPHLAHDEEAVALATGRPIGQFGEAIDSRGGTPARLR